MTHLVDDVEGLLVNDRLLHIRNDLPLGLVILDFLMHLITDDAAFPVHSASGILTVIKDVSDRSLVPTIRIDRTGIGGFLFDGLIVFRGCYELFFP